VALYAPCWLLEPLFLKTLGVGKGFVALVAAGALTVRGKIKRMNFGQ